MSDNSPANSGTHSIARLPISVLGWSLGLFFLITYTLCVLFDLAFPGESMAGLWEILLPWADAHSLEGYLIGAFETVLYGWYVAVVFGGLFNWFAARG